MGIRIKVNYQADNELRHKLLIDPVRAEVAGTEVLTGSLSPIKAKMSKTNREHGLRPRQVILSRTVGTAPDQAKLYTDLPVLSLASWAAPAFEEGSEIEIDGTTWTIVSRLPEDY